LKLGTKRKRVCTLSLAHYNIRGGSSLSVHRGSKSRCSGRDKRKRREE